MHIHCPHCRSPVEVVEDQELRDVVCPSCGSSFNLLPEETVTRNEKEQKTLGHFQLLDRIGVGAFGEVWTAHDKELDRTVAIKLPRKGQLSAEEAESFFREARSAARLHHPGIVTVHEVGKASDQLFIVSDYVRGATLSDWLITKRPTAREAAELVTQIADAVHHAHEHGVVHRDLKHHTEVDDLFAQWDSDPLGLLSLPDLGE
jgi:serine/threonine protein kinase